MSMAKKLRHIVTSLECQLTRVDEKCIFLRQSHIAAEKLKLIQLYVHFVYLNVFSEKYVFSSVCF